MGRPTPSREIFFSGANGIKEIFCLADHEHDWQPYPVDPYSAILMTIHTAGTMDDLYYLWLHTTC